MSRRFVVVGVGGIGTWLSEGLVRMLEYKDPGSMLLLVDGDNFEAKNKERQSFEEYGNKAEVVAKKLTPLFPQTFVIGMAKWVVDKLPEDYDEDAEEGQKITADTLLSEDDVVFAVVDNIAARKLLFDAAKKFENIDIFTGGNDENLFGSVYHYQRRNGIDITDHPVEYHPEYESPPDRNPGQLSCQERAELEGGTQLIATNISVAAWLLGRTQHCIFEGAEPIAGEIQFELGAGLANNFDRRVEPALVSN